MKPFPIFRAGRHTSTSGATAEYTEEMLRAAVEAYDPKLHPAPIVVGHPHDNHPAFGWVGKLSLDDTGHVIADPSDVNQDFAELVKSKAYRTRSASWYLPDAPNNPKPGSMYLRHVGFLGAQPPAIKGLADVQFADNEAGVIEFGDRYQTGILARLLRGLREFFIAEHGLEKADKVLPDWEIQEVEYEARVPPPSDATVAAIPSYAEGEPPPPNTTTDEDDKMTAEKITQLEAEKARLAAELEAAKTEAQKTAEKQSADFAEREADLARRAADIAKREIETRVDALIAEGKVLPANKAHVVSFAASLSDEGECIDFAEAGKGKDVLTQRASYLRMLAQGPKLVEFGERAKDERQGGKPAELTPAEIGKRAADFREEQAKKGILITATEAVEHITAEVEKRAS